MLVVYILTFSLIYCLFHLGWTKRYQKKNSFNKYKAKEISVIIPFRNEINNLSTLKESILQQALSPLEFIWVNDHSEDNSLSLLENLPNNHLIISLNENESGKKSAIRKGIELAKGSYILTWDADITVPSNYFIVLNKQNKSDLTILPVRMKGKRPFEILFELDYYFLNSINISLSSVTNPIVASGANLLFHKSTFKTIDSFKKHKHIPSGDDMFLLQDFKKHQKQIQLLLNKELIVETIPPKTIQTFFQQRFRWISKSTKIDDSTTNLINALGVSYVLGFIYLLFDSNWLIILGYKIIIDLLIFKPYLTVIGRKKITWFIPLFSLLYPFYFMAITIGLIFFRHQKWKGRK
jgi:biofilm PGA synthesis N-glycosyltransferase PgaC